MTLTRPGSDRGTVRRGVAQHRARESWGRPPSSTRRRSGVGGTTAGSTRLGTPKRSSSSGTTAGSEVEELGAGGVAGLDGEPPASRAPARRLRCLPRSGRRTQGVARRSGRAPAHLGGQNMGRGQAGPLAQRRRVRMLAPATGRTGRGPPILPSETADRRPALRPTDDRLTLSNGDPHQDRLGPGRQHSSAAATTAPTAGSGLAPPAEGRKRTSTADAAPTRCRCGDRGCLGVVVPWSIPRTSIVSSHDPLDVENSASTIRGLHRRRNGRAIERS